MRDDAFTLEVIIVSYKSASLVHQALERWQGEFRVCVIDNAANGDGLASSTQPHPEVRYLALPGVGFTRAANTAVKTATADILVFVNPDAEVTAEQIRDLTQGLYTDPDAICHAALEELLPGTYCGGGWEPTLQRSIVHALGLHRVFPSAGIIALTDTPRSVEVDWVTGSVAAYRASDLKAMGGFDERFYVYSEDVAFGYRARQLGRRQVVRDDVLISPLRAGSGAPGHEMTRLQGASFANYLDLYGNGASSSAIKLVLSIGFLARAILAAATGSFSLSRSHLMFVAGLLSRRAFVAGNEVSRTRLREMSPTAEMGPLSLGRKERPTSSPRRHWGKSSPR